jgi:hypothetical protein
VSISRRRSRHFSRDVRGNEGNSQVFGLIVQPFGEQRWVEYALVCLFFECRGAVARDEIINTAGWEGIVRRFGRWWRGRTPPKERSIRVNEDDQCKEHQEKGTYDSRFGLVTHSGGWRG